MRTLNEEGAYEGHILTKRKDGTMFWAILKGKSFDHSQYGRMYTCCRDDLTSLKLKEKQVEVCSSE